jgi:hypothetical protein
LEDEVEVNDVANDEVKRCFVEIMLALDVMVPVVA